MLSEAAPPRLSELLMLGLLVLCMDDEMSLLEFSLTEGRLLSGGLVDVAIESASLLLLLVGILLWKYWLMSVEECLGELSSDNAVMVGVFEMMGDWLDLSSGVALPAALLAMLFWEEELLRLFAELRLCPPPLLLLRCWRLCCD